MSEDRTLETEASEHSSAPLRLTPASSVSIIWAGTGVLWTLSGGVPKLGDGLLGNALAAETPAFTFLQISDSHIGLRQERP
jgi:hypothetical protein